MGSYSDIDSIILQLKELLKSQTAIDEELFSKLVGKYSKALKHLLNQYFSVSLTEQKDLSPYINYYRQVQHYLVFILRYPTILLVPNHSEILQTLKYIDNKTELINSLYIPMSKRNRTLLEGEFKKKLEENFRNRNELDKLEINKK
jgi:hypothetical protein